MRTKFQDKELLGAWCRSHIRSSHDCNAGIIDDTKLKV